MSPFLTTDDSPIFIIGTERSGTNLLRLMIDSHSAITVPHPPHIMKLFSQLEAGYGNLRQEENFRRLIDDVCTMVELHPYPWEIRPDRERVYREALDHNLITVYFAIHEQYLEWSGKRRWCCKSTFMIEHVDEILRYYPHARFIFMVRDARDVAVSAKESIFNHFHVYYTALRWQREQRTGLDLLARLPDEQILLLKYEELIESPRETLQRLCAFLGEEFEEQMLEYHRSAEARKSGSLSISWQNTSRPLLRDNREKFRTRLKAREIFMIESICLDELTELGYPLSTDRDRLRSSQQEMLRPRLAYFLVEFFMRLGAEARHLVRDRNSLQRMKKLIFMKYIGWRRKSGK